MPPAADTAAAAALRRVARASRARKKESRPTGLAKVPTVAMIVAPIAMVRWCGDHSCLAVFQLPVLSGFKRSDASSSEGEPCAPCPWRTQHARALAKLLCPEVTSGEPCEPVRRPGGLATWHVDLPEAQRPKQKHIGGERATPSWAATAS